MIFIYFFTIVTFLFAGWRIWRRLRYFLHIFQLEGYKQNEYRRWVGKRLSRVAIRLSHKLAAIVLVIGFWGFFKLSAYWTALFILPVWTVLFISSRLYRSHQEKKPLKYTARLKRLLVGALIISCVPLAAGLYSWATIGLAGLFWVLTGLLIADFGAPLWVIVAAVLMNPVEQILQNGFKRKARKKLSERPDLKVIGITGSYGKTSVKFILAEILKQRYSVLATPSSYNTPMGLCIVVNNMLKPEHQILVLEMGARYRGDIKELCTLAQPEISVVTSVGLAHLETLGSIEDIAQEKGDILENMRSDGIAVLNVDSEHIAGMASRAPGKIWRVSVEGKEAEISASDVQYGPSGTDFTVIDQTGGRTAFHTRLLGKHNVLNVLLGVAVGREMGLRLRQIAHAVERVRPIEHRLQLRQEGAVTIIDDAFNSNPIGARNAIEILGQFKTGRRIIVTPGMIELGERQEKENRLLGEHIAKHVDLAILIGEEQTRPILEGLQQVNFPKANIRTYVSLFDAQAYLKTILQKGDVVLYENDLPDQYTEM